MKYCVLIMDGAAGLPLPEHGGKTSLELACTPNLDAMAKQGQVGMVKTVPSNLEPDSAVACMSLFGYDPEKYYRGRAPIEAMSLGIPFSPGEVLFRCNLVTIEDNIMVSHSAGSITTGEAHQLVEALNRALGNDNIKIFPGTGYRSILKMKNARGTARAVCTPPHDIPGKPVLDYLPRGEGSELLLDLMTRSQAVLKDHPVNQTRAARGDLPATSIWLFWGSGHTPHTPSFRDTYKLRAAVTSGVNLLNGLGKMTGMDLLETPGVTDGLDNDYDAQAKAALDALKNYDIVIVHIETPDEAGHIGSVKEKVEAIEKIDAAVVGRLLKWGDEALRVLVSPDHPTPIPLRTHTSDPVPFLLWGKGIKPNGAQRLTESEAKKTLVLINPGYRIMRRLIGE
ncbi:MAG: cofactor-independent phosphoglycerate mutase [Dehalococcoidia bacterium]|nr:cofactor-independent phosphoglycerate mutase [Dehalococcoidia bacterium]